MPAIRIFDGGTLIPIGFQDIEKYHGQLAIMAVAVGFRVLQAAFRELFGDEAPRRQDISIRSGHAGPGFRDAFEFVTRAVTRGVYQVDVHYPRAQHDPYRPQSYAFIISGADGRAVEVALNENFLPLRFFELLAKGRNGTTTSEEQMEMERLKRSLADRALAMPQAELLSIQRIA